MKIEAVVVCVNYSDFLSHTLPHNKQLFDKIVVVTDLKDEKTKKLCEFYNVECVQTDEFYRNSVTINKGRGINEGLKRLKKDDWVLHLDADIFLPPMFREIMERLPLDKNGIFGIDRMMCPTYEAWAKFMCDPRPLHEGWIFIHTNIFPIGVRIAEYKSDGWEPIGFFQMWHPNVSGIYDYPSEHGAIDRSDVIHAKKWIRANRHLIPEIIGIHLESEALELSEMGRNWTGRKSMEFGPDHKLLNKKSTLSNRIGIKFYIRMLWYRFLSFFK